jgi:hypothetical protein
MARNGINPKRIDFQEGVFIKASQAAAPAGRGF